MAKVYILPPIESEGSIYYWTFNGEAAKKGALYKGGKFYRDEVLGVEDLRKRGCRVLTEEEYVLHVLERET